MLKKQNIINHKIRVAKNIFAFKDYKEGFIVASVNATFLSEVIYRIDKNSLSNRFIFWPDGILSVLITGNFYKVPGRELLENVLNDCIKNDERVCFVGDPLPKNNDYLNKFKWINKEVSYGSADELSSEIDFINERVVVLNIPSPKQEELAIKLLDRYPHSIIFCTGGALNMLIGLEDVTPKILYKYGLEWFWRLKTDSKRRLKRLFKIIISMPFSIINFKKNFYHEKL